MHLPSVGFKLLNVLLYKSLGRFMDSKALVKCGLSC